jgi:hypothetical protein
MGKHTAFLKLSARQGSVSSLAALNTKKMRVPKTTRAEGKKSSKQKQLDTMQPSDELAAVFGICGKPSFTRSKL